MLVIRHSRHWYEPRFPHLLFINGFYAGTLRNDVTQFDIPDGSYCFRIQFGGKLPIGKTGKNLDLSVSSTQQINIRHGQNTIVTFHDRERLWNILFDIDLVVWITSFFITLPTIYKIISDAFFVLWLLRLLLIRKQYYRIGIRYENNE